VEIKYLTDGGHKMAETGGEAKNSINTSIYTGIVLTEPIIN
jgi:hypothetical protein